MSDLNCQILSDDFSNFDLSFKIILVGDSGVGKSCLSIKASRNYFEDFYSPTVGFEFLTFNVKVEDQNIKLQIWDTCGQEVYRSLISSFYRSASLAIIVYSIDSEERFSNIEKWLNDIKSQSNPNIKIFLIGNKADLEDKRQVTKENGENFFKQNKLSFFTETSAKTGFNVQNVFIEVAKVLYKEHEEIKNRISRPGSMAPVPYTPEIPDNNIALETGEDNDDKPRKKKCC
jgi:small GTP-binding protein